MPSNEGGRDFHGDLMILTSLIMNFDCNVMFKAWGAYHYSLVFPMPFEGFS